MATSYTLTSSLYPNGTTVSVYAPTDRHDGAAPSGSSIASAVVSGGAVTFAGLPNTGGLLAAYAFVSGEHRYQYFYDQPSAVSAGTGVAGGIVSWAASTAYKAGQLVIAPDASVQAAKADFTSGAAFSQANWTRLAPPADRPLPVGPHGAAIVGTRPAYTSGNPANGEYQRTSVIKDVIATDCADIRLVYAATISNETDLNQQTQIKATVEFPAGTFYPVTFRGQLLGTLDSGGILVSDPVPIELAAGSVVYYRTLMLQPSGAQGIATYSSGATSITMTSVSAGAFAVGQFISAAGVPTNTTITSITGTAPTQTLNLSATITSNQTGQTVSAGTGKTFYTHVGQGDGNEGSTASSDLTSTAGALTNGGAVAGPLCVVADRVYGTRRPVVLMVGDSISAGTGYTNSNYATRDRTGYNTIAIGAGGSSPTYTIPHLIVAKASETTQTFATVTSSRRRRQVFDFASSALVMYGTNDTARTLAQLQGDIIAIWQSLYRRGIAVFGCTLLPRSSSTDAWVTATNQTKALSATPESVRTGFNDWLRDGAPTNPATLAPQPVGTADSATCVRTTLTKDGGGGTFTVTGTRSSLHLLRTIFDTGATVEVDSSNALTTNGGLWIAPGGVAQTADGLHPNTVGHARVAAAVDAKQFV